ncbi:MAG: hypothetical protein ABIJ16_12380, partial [Bacteroidota bacterium]
TALNTHYARSKFDHNRNNGAIFYQVPAYLDFNLFNPMSWPNTLLPGKADGVVPFHSSCGYRVHESYSKCMGEYKTYGILWWRRTEYLTAWDAHRMHPAISIYGLNSDHGVGTEWGYDLW